MPSAVNSNTTQSLVQSFVVVINILVCMIMAFQAFNCATASQRIFELYAYPPNLNQTTVATLYAASAFLAILFTFFIIKKKMWALNAIVILYLIRMLMNGQIDYFFLSLILIHVILYFPLRKVYR